MGITGYRKLAVAATLTIATSSQVRAGGGSSAWCPLDGSLDSAGFWVARSARWVGRRV